MTGTGDDESRSALHELADAAGISGEYFDVSGVKHFTSDETRRALLAALGFDAQTDAAARESLAALRAADAAEILAPVCVSRVDEPGPHSLAARLPWHAEHGRWQVVVHPEQGEPLSAEGQSDGGDVQLPLPDLPPGYHRVALSVSANGREWICEQTVIRVPARCVLPADLLGGDTALGLIANLYTVRSATNWGVGDFTDLASLASWGATIGADFVGVNPLHALLNRGPDVGPYSPISRIFRNPIYIDVERVPELSHAPEVRDRLGSPEIRAELEALRAEPSVRYEPVMAAKGLALDALHRVFTAQVRGTGNARDLAHAAWVESQGTALRRFATWMAIAEVHGRDWRSWPAELRDPEGPAVARFVEAHGGRVAFHQWLQFELDRQLGEASRVARKAGMRIGLYQDLAIGTSAASADTWAFPGLFARGVSIGAPPDPYAATGQNWELPPIDPRALRRSGYEYFINLVRGGFRHGGALRIDHVMGLFRLFWIPEGQTGAHGAYVRYPAEDLLGIIALESARNGAIVVGEDLGTVPAEVPPTLTRWGVLSSKVLYFERDWSGAFKPTSEYPRLALATANTHDMPTIAGFWQGRDIEVRARVGMLPTDEAVQQALDDRERDRQALVALLAMERILPIPTVFVTPAVLCSAVHTFLRRTPAELVGLSLDDLGGELESINVPGVGPDRHPSWTRKMRLTLEEIATSDDVRAVLPMARPAN